MDSPSGTGGRCSRGLAGAERTPRLPRGTNGFVSGRERRLVRRPEIVHGKPSPKNMKKVLTLVLALACCVAASASSTQAVEEAFQRYWSAVAQKDFAKAAGDILPSDLEDLRKTVLPVFVAAQGHKSKEMQELINTFFGRAVGKARENLSAQEVFLGLNRILVQTNPLMFDLMKQAKTTIVFVRTVDADNVEIHFQITVQAESEMEVEAFTRRNGRWWVRLKDEPQETAEQFKALFARDA